MTPDDRQGASSAVGVTTWSAPAFPTERRAVIQIARADTFYTLASLQGPPGSLVSFSFAGDSAHVVWNLGYEQMLVDLRGAGDSLVGRWATVGWSGELLGFRRR